MRKNRLLIVIAAAVAVLLACIAVIVVPIVTHKSAGGSGQDLNTVASGVARAEGDDGRVRTLKLLTPAGQSVDVDRLKPGSEVVVEGTGYDPGIGIYVSFCKLPEQSGQRPGPCLGEIPASAEKAKQHEGEVLSSAWVTNDMVWRTFATHSYRNDDGDFRAELVVPEAATDALDCHVSACALVTRADHTASGDRVQDIAIPVQFAGQ